MSDGWGTACPPDFASTVIADHSLVRSLTEDVARGRVVAVTIDGAVATVTGDAARIATSLPLGDLVDRSTVPIGPRKGVVDPHRDTLWVPIQQTLPAGTCTLGSCVPRPLDQWLARIDLTQI